MAAELFGPADIPKIVGLPDLRSHNLTAEEGFLLSRIDGRTNVRGLLALVSWEREKTFELLESLLRKHVVNFDRPEILDRVNAGARQTNSGAGPTGNGAGATAGAGVVSTIDPATIEKVPDLDAERCIEILEWSSKVKKAATLYELFGIPDGADFRSVKREYRQLAMKFHPDKFFRKEIGTYRARIDESWKAIQEAYEKLTDPASKAAYDTEILSSRPPRVAAAPAAAPNPSGASSAHAEKPWMAPPPPPGVPAAASAAATPSRPAAPLPQVPTVDPRPKMESAFERKIRQEVRERVEKGQRHFEQAQADFKEKKYIAADSNVKLALQFDSRNEEYQKWYNSVKPVLEESIISGIVRRGELAELAHDLKAAQEAYEHALSLFPENIAANRALALLLLLKGDPNIKRTKECLTKVVTANPKDFDATLALAKALRLMGMSKNAQRILDQARDLNAKDPRLAEEAKELKKLK